MPSSRARRAAARRAAAARRTRLAVGGLGLVVVGVGGVVAAMLAGGDGGGGASGGDDRPLVSELARAGSVRLEGRGAGLVEIGDEPDAYRVAYRVRTFSGGDEVVSRDEVAIARPFVGHTVKRDGPSADDGVRSEQWADLGRLFVPSSPTAQAALVETGPSIAPSDLRIGPVLAEVVAAGRAEAREWRRIAGRACQVVRFGGPITSGTVALELDAGSEYADACVSEQGLVLEELWVVDGRVQRHRLATDVDVTGAAGDAVAFPSDGLPDPLPVDDGGGSFRAVDPASAYEAPFWVVPDEVAASLGRHAGRWAVVAPAGSDPKDEESQQRRLGYVADVYVSGIDVVVVEQGSTAGGVKAFELGGGPRVTVEGGLGEGEVVLDLRTSEVRFARPRGYFLKVRGTVSGDRLTEIARSLRETPGGTGLVYLDDR